MNKLDWVGLANPTGSFVDPETGFRISLGEVRLLQYPVGELTKRVLNAGGLVPRPAPVALPIEPEPVAEKPDHIPEPVSVESKQTVEELEGLPVEELREMCRSRGLKYSNRSGAHVLALKLVESDGS